MRTQLKKNTFFGLLVVSVLILNGCAAGHRLGKGFMAENTVRFTDPLIIPSNYHVTDGSDPKEIVTFALKLYEEKEYRQAAKFFLDASLETRGKRRYEQYLEGGKVFDRETITQEIAKRDRDDMKRALSPLKPADGAVTIDSTGMTIEEVVESMMQVIVQYLSPSSK